ncbi:hypothetical protein [Mycolicibacter senuensis]|uniref:hypothetical protein n=1 Tax=Mycolicibacter senuensis TaxID=386913 RepID=UPI000DCDBA35|nr:hypothetical protein [Mycolicibacter senuensis]RAV02813.1 hypothetical protein DQP56_04390 [Mycolicibacter senuensis]
MSGFEEVEMDFARLRLSENERAERLAAQTECTLTWLRGDGWPVAAIQTYVWERDAFWVTSFRDRPRVPCLIAEPRSAVAVSSAGSAAPPERMVSARTLATVHTDPHVGNWFYPAFCRRATSDDAAATVMARALARQDRVIIELRPQSWNSFDGGRLRG